MASFLDKLLAQVNVRDGGKTWKSLEEEEKRDKKYGTRTFNSAPRSGSVVNAPTRRVNNVVNAQNQNKNVQVRNAPVRSLLMGQNTYQNRTRTQAPSNDRIGYADSQALKTTRSLSHGLLSSFNKPIGGAADLMDSAYRTVDNNRILKPLNQFNPLGRAIYSGAGRNVVGGITRNVKGASDTTQGVIDRNYGLKPGYGKSEQIAQTAGDFIGQLGTGMIAGSAGVPAALMGTRTYGDTFRNNQDQGKSFEESRNRATGNAIVSAVLEKAGMDTVANNATSKLITKFGNEAIQNFAGRGAGKLVTNAGGRFVGEGGTEGTQQIVDNLANSRQWNEGVGEAFTVGGILGSGAGVGFDLANPNVRNQLKQDLNKAKQVAQDANTPKEVRLNLKDQDTLMGLSDFISGEYNASGSERNALLADARRVGAKHKVDLINGSPNERMDRIAELLDRIHMDNQSYRQGGYVSMEPTSFRPGRSTAPVNALEGGKLETGEKLPKVLQELEQVAKSFDNFSDFEKYMEEEGWQLGFDDIGLFREKMPKAKTTPGQFFKDSQEFNEYQNGLPIKDTPFKDLEDFYNQVTDATYRYNPNQSNLLDRQDGQKENRTDTKTEQEGTQGISSEGSVAPEVKPVESVVNDIRNGDRVDVDGKEYTYNTEPDGIAGKPDKEYLYPDKAYEDYLVVNRNNGKVTIETIYEGDKPIREFQATQPTKGAKTPEQTLESQSAQSPQPALSARQSDLSTSSQQDATSDKTPTQTESQAESPVAQTARPEEKSKSFDNIIQDSVKLLPAPTPTNAGLLPSGTIKVTPGQAKQKYKGMTRRGNSFEVQNTLPAGRTPFSVTPTGETRQGSNTIKITERGGGKDITVKRNAPALNDINPSLLKDISGYGSRMKDLWRNTKKVFGPQYQTVKERVLDPLDRAKGRYVDFQEAYAQDLKENIVDKYNIKKGSVESKHIQLFGEGKIDQKFLEQIYGKQRALQLVEADKFFRARYDQLLDQINDSRLRTYNGNKDKLIPKRKDYYRHFQEMQQGIDGLLNIFENSAAISPELQGISQGTKPKSKWLSLAQQRKGDQTEYDAVGGYINYLQAASYATNIDPEIARIRNFANSLREANTESDNPVDLENYLTFLDDYANDLAGKTNDIDRVVMKMTGRKAFAVADWVNKRAKANAILGNFASSVAQFYNMPIGLSDAGWTNAPAGFTGFVKNLTGGKTPADKSIFLKERFGDPLSQFDVKLMDKAQNGAAHLVQVGDEVGTRIIWHAQYSAAKGKGMSDANAVKFADDRTRATVAGRGVGEVPLAQKAKAFQMIAPFQLEVANQWHVFGDWKQEGAGKMAKGLVGYSIAAALMNAAAEEIRGNGVIFDPIEALVDAWGELGDEDDPKTKDKDESKDNIIRAGGRLAGEVVSNIPGGAYVGQALVSNPFDRKAFFGDEDPTRFGTSPLAITSTVGNVMNIAKDPDNLYGYLKAATGLGTPFGGKQIERTTKAGADLLRGYSTDRKGNPTFTAPDNPIRQAQALLFGTNASPSGRDYYDNERRALSESQAEQFEALPQNQRQMFMDRLNEQREAKKNGTSSGTQATRSVDDAVEGIKQSFGGKYASYTEDELKELAKTDENAKAYQTNLAAVKQSGKEPEALPEGLNDAAVKLYEKEARLTTEGKAKWKAQKADKAITSDIHSWIPEGVEKPPVNNEIALKWANLQKKAANGELGNIEAESESKSIAKAAYNSQLDENERDLYSLSEANLLSAYERGLINDTNIDNALKVERQLFDAGLINRETLHRKLGKDARGYKSGKGGKGGRGGKGKKAAKWSIPAGFSLIPDGPASADDVLKLLQNAMVRLPKS